MADEDNESTALRITPDAFRPLRNDAFCQRLTYRSLDDGDRCDEEDGGGDERDGALEGAGLLETRGGSILGAGAL
jgi:hypothetical protein